MMSLRMMLTLTNNVGADDDVDNDDVDAALARAHTWHTAIAKLGNVPHTALRCVCSWCHITGVQ